MTIYEQRLREWRDPELWPTSVLTPHTIGHMTGATPMAVCGWIRRHGLPAITTNPRKGIVYKIDPRAWLEWANANRPRIFALALPKTRACPPPQWGGVWVKPEVSPIVTVHQLVELEKVTHADVWRACQRGLPHGYNAGKLAVALNDWHWWKARNVRNISAREIAK